MSETNNSQAVTQAPIVEITEEALQKSLNAIAGIKEEAAAVVEPKVVTAVLQKTASQSVDGKASQQLKKALEVSQVLNEAVNLMGMHVDESLNVLQKSLDATAQRDKVFVEVLTSMKKSLDSMQVKIEEYGKTPAGTPKTVVTSATETQTEVLQKNLQGAQTQAAEKKGLDVKSDKGKRTVLMALETLTKSAKTDMDRDSFIRAAVKFETTGIIDDRMLYSVRPVLKEMGVVA